MAILFYCFKVLLEQFWDFFICGGRGKLKITPLTYEICYMCGVFFRSLCLETSAKIFTYLNFCPPFDLLSFYQDLFKNVRPKSVLFALISMIKQSQNGERESALKIFKKVTEIIDLMKYHSIENLLNEIDQEFEKQDGTGTCYYCRALCPVMSMSTLETLKTNDADRH